MGHCPWLLSSSKAPLQNKHWNCNPPSTTTYGEICLINIGKCVGLRYELDLNKVHHEFIKYGCMPKACRIYLTVDMEDDVHL